MLGIETCNNGFTDACMAVFDADDVRCSDRWHLFFISRPLLLNTRLLLTSVHEKASGFVPTLRPKQSHCGNQKVPRWD